MFDAFCVKRCTPRIAWRPPCVRAPAKKRVVTRHSELPRRAGVGGSRSRSIGGPEQERRAAESRCRRRWMVTWTAATPSCTAPRSRRSARARSLASASSVRTPGRTRSVDDRRRAQCHSFCVCQAHSDFRALPQTSPSFRPGLRPRCCSQTMAPTSAKSSRRHVPPHFFI